MTTITIDAGGPHTATTYTGVGSGLTGIPLSGLTSGTPNQVIISDGSGNLTGANQLSTTRGGIGADSSAFTGVAKVSAGTWSASTIVNADVSAVAAIARSKLASGTASHVIINDGSGVLSSEAQLAVSRGGTGQDFSAVTGPVVATVTSGVFAATLTYATANTNNALVQRDGSGNVNASTGTFTSVVTPTVSTSSGNLTISPNTGITSFGTGSIQFVPATIAGGRFLITTANIQTTNATTTTLTALSTPSSGTNGTNYHVRAFISLGDATGASATATYLFSFKVKNIGGTLTATNLVNRESIVDNALNATAVSVTTGINVTNIRVTGIAATNINWCGRFQLTSQDF